MFEEITADVLFAANDLGAGSRIAFGMVLDLPAAVIVHASAPRGRGYFEFAARQTGPRGAVSAPAINTN